MPSLSVSELRSRLADPDVVLIDVLPREHFAEVHLPGAVNACVYEVSFLDQVRAAIGTRRALVVYGAGPRTREAAVAAEKLAAAGLGEAAVFAGGLEAWEQAGEPLERGTTTAEAEPSGTFRVDVDRSVVRWTGRNLFNHHEGTVRLGGGSVELVAGRPVSGEFVVDLRTIACADLSGELAAGLVRHLLDPDFFDVASFPEARFTLRAAEPLADATPGAANFTLSGELAVRGMGLPFAFPAVIAAKGADEIVGQAQVTFDRTAWGAIYGSGRFFSFLGPHVVNDLVDLHLKVIAVRA